MDSPVKDLARIGALLTQARERLAVGSAAEAEASVLEAAALDPRNAQVLDLLAEIHAQAGQPDRARREREQAKQLRREAWQRQVEAEARGHHELLGEPIRHELP
jgi:Flp pilus assembly protein TadD